MAEIAEEINERFAQPNNNLAPDVLAELQSMLRLHAIRPSELFFKWESYAIKMGSDNVKLDLKTVRDFKKDIHEALERETRTKQAKVNERRAIGTTPRNARGVDMFGGLIDGVSPATPRLPMNGVNGNSVKRKSAFDTPASKATKPHADSSPHGPKDTPVGFSVAFKDRKNAGQIMEILNEHIPVPEELPETVSEEPRIKLKANTELQKFSYKPMAMKLSGASEILDDRIDAFLEIIQEHYELEDSAFGNPAHQSSNEIVTIGRIASDSGDGKLNASSVVLETSRRMGSGLRVPLKLDAIPSYDLFPGKIVAVKGTNVSGDYFSVSEMMDMPPLSFSQMTTQDLDVIAHRVARSIETGDARPLNVIITSGPYTADDNLDFEPLHALCEKAKSTNADALIMLGPFLDIEHPLIASGELPPFPPGVHINPNVATMTDVFKVLVGDPLTSLAASLKSITILMVPSVRDTIQKHISFPQDRMKRAEFGLPKQATIVTNPVMISLNETIFGISSQDVLSSLRADNLVVGPNKNGLLERLCRNVIEQRHFYPIFPPTSRETFSKPSASLVDDIEAKATGPMLDITYMALGEWSLRPDVLITPSTLAPFAKVVDGVVCVNPGTLSKKRGAGTFAQMTLVPLVLGDADTDSDCVEKKVYERARIVVVRI